MATIAVPDMKERPLVLDTSKHNGKLTAAQIKSTGCVKVTIRTGISYRYVDPLFNYYRDLCNEIEMPWDGYHVLYPSQPAWPQAENVKAIIGDDPGQCAVPVWNDLELNQSASAAQIAECCQEFGEELQQAFGGEKGIYSRASFIDSYMPGRIKYFADYLWWLAQVLNGGVEHPGPYALAVGMDVAKVVMIQNDWKGKIAGHNGDVDFSRWIRSEAELAQHLGINVPDEPGLPAEPPEDALDILWADYLERMSQQ
jgi:GH25 family lysozyme M1 (1,4-beta-N-acetylmuramidase)